MANAISLQYFTRSLFLPNSDSNKPEGQQDVIRTLDSNGFCNIRYQQAAGGAIDHGHTVKQHAGRHRAQNKVLHG